MPQAFDPENTSWSSEYTHLKELLEDEEYKAARESVLNAHYTSPTVIRGSMKPLGALGLTTGNILEPACGVGNFFGMLPENMSGSRLYGVELDSISGRIAKQLYPNADITVAGFETTDRRNFYDLAVGNVPFGNYLVDDKSYNSLGFRIHNYFFAKALDQVRPGGRGGLCYQPVHHGQQEYRGAEVPCPACRAAGGYSSPEQCVSRQCGN